MTKINKMIASTAATICIGGVGLTAYADAVYFSFSLAFEETSYFDVSSQVHKGNLWSKNAMVEIYGGDLSLDNQAEVAVTTDPSWPESNTITDYKTVSGNYTYTLKYDAKYADDRPNDRNVCLLARTLGGDVYFYGDWEA